mgnify:CR=1 FL=1
MPKECFIVDNITDSDIKYRYIRILKGNKKYFPKEVIGQPESYDIQILYGDKVFSATYIIGSKDHKSRSGRIVFDKATLDDLAIRSGDRLKFEVVVPYRSYSITIAKVFKEVVTMRIVHEELSYSYSHYPELLENVANKAMELMIAMKELRDAYKEKGKLPLYCMNSELENMMIVTGLIESEALKFGVPTFVSKQFNEIDPKELVKIKKDKERLMDMGLDEWLEEGLI